MTRELATVPTQDWGRHRAVWWGECGKGEQGWAGTKAPFTVLQAQGRITCFPLAALASLFRGCWLGEICSGCRHQPRPHKRERAHKRASKQERARGREEDRETQAQRREQNQRQERQRQKLCETDTHIRKKRDREREVEVSWTET